MSSSSRLLANCPLCQTAYEQDGIRLLEEKGTTRLFHCTCQSCGHAMLAIILENAGWMSSVGLVTDLEAKDALRFQSAVPISADECVHIHRLFEHQSQHLCQVLMKAS